MVHVVLLDGLEDAAELCAALGIALVIGAVAERTALKALKHADLVAKREKEDAEGG